MNGRADLTVAEIEGVRECEPYDPWLMTLPPAEATFRSDEAIYFADPLVARLTGTQPLQRLAGIGFLGAIDYIRHGSGRSPHRRRHNRLEHTIGVARLADLYAREAELPEQRRLVLLAAALLHDVGHGPLSHTLEPVFLEKYQLDHHVMTRRVVRGELRGGSNIPKILRESKIDPEEVLAMIDGYHNGPDSVVFSSPINLDTIDGILRCRAFMQPRTAPGAMHVAVRDWAQTGNLCHPNFDAFWSLKHHVYTLLIGARLGALLDSVAQAYMSANIDNFEPDEFYSTEPAFRQRHPLLFKYLRAALESKSSLREVLPKSCLSQKVTFRSRNFAVQRDVNLRNSGAVRERYVQSKVSKEMSLSELIEM